MGMTEKQPLGRAEFLQVIHHTPLVAIDLILEDGEGRILVGLRRNNPAKGWWFVPGGRILKDETLDEAFARISRKELGVELHRDHARLLGVYEHIYPDNVDNADFGTHYVVIGYRMRMPDAVDMAEFAAQHEDARWMSIHALLTDEAVHANTKAYFMEM